MYIYNIHIKDKWYIVSTNLHLYSFLKTKLVC